MTETLNSMIIEESFQILKIQLTAKILYFGRKWTTGPGELAGPPKRKILKVLGNPTQSPFRLTVIRVITSEETQIVRFLNFLLVGSCTSELTHRIKIPHVVSLRRICLWSQRPVPIITVQTPLDASQTC